MKMKMKWIIMGLLSASPAFGQVDLNLPLVGTVDLSNLASNTGGIAALDNHKHRWAGASLRVAWYPQDASAAWLGLEAGALWEPDNGAPSGAFLSMGVRADTAISKIHVLNNIGHLKIPSVEIGPFAAYLSSLKQWVWGVFLAKKFQ